MDIKEIDRVTREWLAGTPERGEVSLLVLAGFLDSEKLAARSLSHHLIHIVAPDANGIYSQEDQTAAYNEALAALARVRKEIVG